VKRFRVPFIGIEPAIKPAALQSKNKSIGILATKGTLNSELFSLATKEFTKDIMITEVIGEGLVPLIEKGALLSSEISSLLEKFLKPMLKNNIDHLVLGCSHYPYLIPQLAKLIPNNIKIIDSGEAVAKQTKNILLEKNLLRESSNQPIIQFITNSSDITLKLLLKGYLEKVDIEKIKF